MSIFNALAAAAASGGLDYEESAYNLTSTTTSRQISFTNSHTEPPAVVMAESISSTSSSYTTFAMCVVYGLLYGTSSGRGGSSNYYAQKISGRGTTTSMTVNGSYTSSNMSSNGITSSSVTLTTNSSYPMATGSWKWIAIWKTSNGGSSGGGGGSSSATLKSKTASSVNSDNVNFSLTSVPTIWWVTLNNSSSGMEATSSTSQLITYADSNYNVGAYNSMISGYVSVQTLPNCTISQYSASTVRVSVPSNSACFFGTGLSYKLYYIE